jgi:hypothetical protein
MQKEIEVNGRKFVVKEMLAVDLDSLNLDDKKESVKVQVISSTGMTEEEYLKLTVKERLAIMNAINELNFQDFHTPAEVKS